MALISIGLKIKLLDGGIMPSYKTQGAACADCYAYTKERITVAPGERVKIPLGFCLEVPEGYKVSIKPRSGLTMNEHIDIILGTIDSDYRGEVNAMLINNSEKYFHINSGDRICQMELEEAVRAVFYSTDELSATERGAGGFGHTGK